MLYAVIKALISGVVIAAASEAAKRSPAIGAIILSLPLTSILAFIWLWRDTSDRSGFPLLPNPRFGSCCRRCRSSSSSRFCCEAGRASGPRLVSLVS